jgi:hypothetical protein
VKWNKYLTVQESRHTQVHHSNYLTVGGNQEATVKKAEHQWADGKIDVSAGKVVGTIAEGDYKVTSELCLEKSAPKITIESKESITLIVGGNFIKVDTTGVTIKGHTVRINVGGVAAPSTPLIVEDPYGAGEAEKGTPGYLDELKPIERKPRRWRTKPTSITNLVGKPDYTKLPDKASIPADICKQMQAGWDKSIDASGNANEHGGTLVTGPDGKMKMVHEGAGTSGTFTPNPTPPPGDSFVGTFHTHPYGKNDGAMEGAHVPQSAGDISSIDDYDQDLDVVQSGDNKYVLVRTDQTPATIDDAEAEAAYDAVFNAEYAAQQAKGKSKADAFSIAGEKATKAVAEKYKLGYYKGTNCGSLMRVSP